MAFLHTDVFRSAILRKDLVLLNKFIVFGRETLYEAEGTTFLHIAVEESDCPEWVIEGFLENHANPDIYNEDGYSSLHVAAIFGNANHLQLLLEFGGDFTIGDRLGNKTPAELAMLNDHVECVNVIENFRMRRLSILLREASSSSTESSMTSSQTTSSRNYDSGFTGFHRRILAELQTSDLLSSSTASSSASNSRSSSSLSNYLSPPGAINRSRLTANLEPAYPSNSSNNNETNSPPVAANRTRLTAHLEPAYPSNNNETNSPLGAANRSKLTANLEPAYPSSSNETKSHPGEANRSKVTAHLEPAYSSNNSNNNETNYASSQDSSPYVTCRSTSPVVSAISPSSKPVEDNDYVDTKCHVTDVSTLSEVHIPSATLVNGITFTAPTDDVSVDLFSSRRSSPESTYHSVDSVPDEMKHMSNDDIFRELCRFTGQNPGPVTDSTRNLYLHQLAHLRFGADAQVLLVDDDPSYQQYYALSTLFSRRQSGKTRRRSARCRNNGHAVETFNDEKPILVDDDAFVDAESSPQNDDIDVDHTCHVIHRDVNSGVVLLEKHFAAGRLCHDENKDIVRRTAINSTPKSSISALRSSTQVFSPRDVLPSDVHFFVSQCSSLYPQYAAFEREFVEFLQSKLASGTTRAMRDSRLRISFNYLLLDSGITQNLPARAHSMSALEQMSVFVRSIFYVGKGTRSRPYSHLYEALDYRERNAASYRIRENEKCRRICDIWSRGHGVVSLHVFHNSFPAEALTRECLIIETIGLNKLTNQRRGEYHGDRKWTVKKRKKLGAFFLHRALQVLLAEGERHLTPADL